MQKRVFRVRKKRREPAGRKRGMGLAHAQRLIEINNGTLTITSEQGKGTRVTVVLPSKL